MDRPSRKTKAINYCDPKDFDDDEDDFACVKAPPSKKMRDAGRQTDPKRQSKSSSQESNSQPPQSLKPRKSLDEKLLDRDLEAAMTLSLLNQAEVKEEATQSDERATKPAEDQATDLLPPVLTKFWEDAPVGAASENEGGAAPNIHKMVEKDDDYTPKLTPGSESDEDLSEAEESEDEDFNVKKAKKTSKKKEAAKKKPKQPATSKRAKQTTTGSTPSSASVKSPPAAKQPSTKPSLPVSPAAARLPKWTPPGQIGKSPSSASPAAKSPGQGLRLGLSRLVRVKPLHPGVASH